MQQQVCGFLFGTDFRRVVLIRKNRPDWQKGKLNGVGGRVEENEDPLQAIRREFEEETGLPVPGWSSFCDLRIGDELSVHFFVAYVADNLLDLVKSKTDESVRVFHANSALLRSDLASNVRWLIPMAIDFYEHDHFLRAQVFYE